VTQIREQRRDAGRVTDQWFTLVPLSTHQHLARTTHGNDVAGPAVPKAERRSASSRALDA
jgi:hypothetical protein